MEKMRQWAIERFQNNCGELSMEKSRHSENFRRDAKGSRWDQDVNSAFFELGVEGGFPKCFIEAKVFAVGIKARKMVLTELRCEYDLVYEFICLCLRLRGVPIIQPLHYSMNC